MNLCARGLKVFNEVLYSNSLTWNILRTFVLAKLCIVPFCIKDLGPLWIRRLDRYVAQLIELSTNQKTVAPILWELVDIFLMVYNKKAQLTQRERATAVHVW